ncbi:MAG: M4 family metallopeptidase [Chloroflexi bacterium]|nr:M4 family metallopeptidase [Chloroflexota bacterium]
MKRVVSHHRTVVVGSVVALCLLVGFVLSSCNINSSELAGAAAAPDQVAAALSLLQTESEGAVQVDTYAPTGAATWVSAEQGVLTRQFARQNLATEAAASSFLNTYGGLFGLTDPTNQMKVANVQSDETGEQHVKFAQQQNGVAVFGANLVVHLNNEGTVHVVNGYTLPDATTVNTTPSISAEAAAQAAIAHVGLADGVVNQSYLEVFNLGLITGETTPSYLVYRVRVDSPSQPELAQWVFVDAASGEIRYAYDAVTEGRNRSTYNRQHGGSGGVLARSEGQAAVTTAPNCTIADVNNAHDLAGDTYDFYFSRFARDSYDNAGGALKSYVCHGNNYQNAYWDGSSMTYGQGFAIDDVVGHELSHAVTERSSGLIYSGQSGGLNESFSDIIGEALDLTNGKGNDAATVRWDMGEDLPGIAGSWICNTDVHYSSAVPNKAFALMVDGGTYNGFTIAGVGIENAVKIEYRANTKYWTPSSKFLDAYRGLNTSCNDLFGATSATCINVKKAMQATNMNGPLCGQPGETNATPTPAPAPGTPAPGAPLVNGDFESGRNVGWTETDTFNYPLVYKGTAQTGVWMAWLVGVDKDTSQIAQSYKVPTGGATLRYAYQIKSTDSCGYDYGYVQANDTVLLKYNLCKTNVTTGYAQGSVSLNAYAGQTVTLKFRATTDTSLSSDFFIDNVNIGAANLVEEVDPHASLGETAPEAKPLAPPTDNGESKESQLNQQSPEDQSNKIFLPQVNK